MYIHLELLLPRAFGKKDLIYVSYTLTIEEIKKHGGKAIISEKPVSLFDNTVLISGEIPRLTQYEIGLPDEYKLKGTDWVCSPDVIDERCLIFNLKDTGLCVITGCGHTGIINATEYALTLLHRNMVYCVMGGFHLAGPESIERIAPTIADLQRINPHYIITGHCTGRTT